MSDSLRDQLLALGFRKPEPKPEQRHATKPNDSSARNMPKPGSSLARRAPGASNATAHSRPGSQDPAPQARPKPHGNNSGVRSTREEIDLAKAYAIRAQTDKAERQRTEQAAAELARQKKERKLKLGALLLDKARNDASAEIARNFPQGEKIRRIYVTADQLKSLNAGELGVVQHMGRYLLVDRDTALAAQVIAPEALALLPDPNAPVEDDVPPDLVW